MASSCYRLESASVSGGKFWKIWREKRTTFTAFGKLGTNGSTKEKTHKDEETAEKFILKQLKAKKKKGYVESSNTSNDTSSGKSPSSSAKKRKKKTEQRSTCNGRKRYKKTDAAAPMNASSSDPPESTVSIAQCRFLMTGTLSVSRKKMAEEIEALGGAVVSAITKATHLLCSEADGHGTSKHTAAVKRGVPVVSEAWVRARLNSEDTADATSTAVVAASVSATTVPPGIVAPKEQLADGGVRFVQGSAETPYTIKRNGSVYSCTCPAWRNQSRKVDQRTCKHIRKIRGDAAEAARVGSFVRKSSGGEAASGKGGGSSRGSAPKLLLAKKYTGSQSIEGWHMSEKLDGIRAYWDKTKFVSRLGNVFDGAPKWFMKLLPSDMDLDGELFAGRGKFSETSSIVRTSASAVNAERWKTITYKIFDSPETLGELEFEQRIMKIRERLGKNTSKYVDVIEHVPCRSAEHLAEELARIEAAGGEGLMLRKPRSKYIGSRSSTLLKVKTFHDTEAKVVGYKQGKGKHGTVTGSLHCELSSGIRFYVGTGLSDEDRRDPPKIGSVITFRYFEMSKDGVPRFPSFLRERPDFVWAGCCGE